MRRWGDRSRRATGTWKRRGVSDVVGTILLLALTVTLFSSIFFFVSTFPTPPPQPTNQFSASLTYQSGTNNIVGVSVLHLAGPAVSGNALIYLYSAKQPGVFTTPFSVSSGLNNSPVWNLGQTWVKNISSFSLAAPDNITISLTTQTQLLFRVTLPGLTLSTPPTFLQVGTTPSSPGVAQPFTVFAQISDPTLNTHSVFANLSLIPGITGTGLFAMSFSASTGLWTANVPSGVTQSSGTFYIFVNATDLSKIRNSVAFTVSITASASGFSAALVSGSPAPMTGSPDVLTAYVTASGAGGGVTSVFTANGAAIGSSSAIIASGSTGGLSVTWTPSTPGSYLLQAAINVSGGAVVATATLNLTVFPPILLIAHNVPGGVRTTFNESAFLSQELTADGIPYTSMWVPCSSPLPPSATMNLYSVVIIDFGSTWTGGCPKAPSLTDQGAITGSTGPRFLLVGAYSFGVTTCTSYSSAYFGLVGATWASSGTCITVPNATVSPTYSANSAIGLRADGIPASLTINQTLGASSKFVPYDWFTKGVTGTAFLKSGTNVIGVVKSGGSAALLADPAMFTTPLPNGNAWGTGSAGSALVYNLMGFLTGVASSSGPGRSLSDYGLSQVQMLGLSHSKVTTFYVGVRENGASPTTVKVVLLVNGTVALYNGIVVFGSASLASAGATAWITLTWQAPANGPFSLAVAFSGVAGDLYPLNDQMPVSILNQATSFT